MPIKIQIVDDVAQFLRGVGKAEDALDDVADALDDVARDAQKTGKTAGDDLSQGIDRGADKAEDSVGKLEKSFRDMAREAGRHSKDAGNDVGDNLTKGFRKAGDAADKLDDDVDAAFDKVRAHAGDAADEIGQTGREAAASFSGEFDDVADVIQEALTNVPAVLGPIGLAAGVAAGAGAGVFLTQWQEAAEAAEERLQEMYDDFLESGADYLSKEFISSEINKIYKDAPGAIVKVQELRDMATATDIPEPLLARALVGDAAARDQVSRLISEKKLEASQAIDEAFAKGADSTPWTVLAQNVDEVQRNLDRTAKAAADAQAAADAARQAINGIDAGRAAASAEDARAKFDGLGRQISSLPQSKTVRVEADTTQLDRELARERTVRVGVATRPGIMVAI